jgi:TrmH family RNA methyltransferase
MCGILNLKCSAPYCNQMQKTETITSAANPLIKDVRRAIAQGGLTADGLCVAETFHLLDEALRSDSEIAAVLVSESARAALEQRPLRRVLVMPDALMRSLSATETSQGVLALVRPREWSIEQMLTADALIVTLDGVQDPGNVGTIVRAAEAFGATGVVLLKGTASPHNPKTLRASAGSLFRLPYLHGVEPASAVSLLREHNMELYAAVRDRTENPPLHIAEADLAAPCAFVIGNEARGISSGMRSAAQELAIPTAGVESLNAAMAATVLLYEARRQRGLRQ